ncbi:hypothetical protein [Actinoplanes sp. ATCC 53533]|uniref:hypothetical protein n=1 Tax=Actinoplanes sp. ATCC 53533 TaxID=1288362 RepID=UPI000F7AB0CB|nr:hypothetical protein [Actinoplanes sp. ATCC 53533]
MRSDSADSDPAPRTSATTLWERTGGPTGLIQSSMPPVSIVLIGSILLRRPLVGVLWNAMHGIGMWWRHDHSSLSKIAMNYPLWAAALVVIVWAARHADTGYCGKPMSCDQSPSPAPDMPRHLATSAASARRRTRMSPGSGPEVAGQRRLASGS